MTCSRGFLVAGALVASYLGLSSGWLALRSSAPIDLAEEAALASAKTSPYWATALGHAAPAGPLVIASESGKSQAWVPLVPAADQRTAVAFVITSLDHGRKLQSLPRTFRIEGMARLPTPAEGKRVADLCAEAGLVPSPAFRMLEAGGRPPSIEGSSALLLLAAGLFGAALKLRRPASRPRRTPLAAAGEGVSQPAAGRESLPLPEDWKLEVARMVREAWNRALSPALAPAGTAPPCGQGGDESAAVYEQSSAVHAASPSSVGSLPGVMGPGAAGGRVPRKR